MKIIVLLVAITMMMVGCFRRDLENVGLPEWRPTVAVPLIFTEISANDILENVGPEGYVRAGDNDIVELVYEHEVLTLSGADIFRIPDFNFSLTDLEKTIVIPLEWPENDLLKSIALTTGLIEYIVEAREPTDGVITFSIPQATRDGVAYTWSIPTDKGQATYAGQIDLSGYLIDFDPNSGSNSLAILYDVVGNDSEVNDELARFQGKLKDLEFSYVEGFLKSFQLLPRHDTIDIDITSNWVSGSITLVNPRILFLLQSDLGFPLNISISNVSAIGTVASATLTGSIVTNGWQSPGGTNAEYDTAAISDENSNISDFLSISPQEITYQISLNAAINSESPGMYRLKGDSRIRIDAAVEVPFQCAIRDAVVRDTFDIRIDTIQNIEALSMRLEFENSFPHDLWTQLYLLDDEGVLIDSLLANDSQLMRSGEVDEVGNAISPATKLTTIDLSQEKLNNVYRATRMVVGVRVATAGGGEQFVRYTTSNFLKVKVGAIATLRP